MAVAWKAPTNLPTLSSKESDELWELTDHLTGGWYLRRMNSSLAARKLNTVALICKSRPGRE
jgi:hypothetical protein